MSPPRAAFGASSPESEVSSDSRAPDPAERALVDRARAGDRDAFRSLVEQHQDQVFRIAMRVLRRDRQSAEDVCQDVFLRAYRGLSGFDGAVKFGIWIHTIAKNASLSEYRRRRTLKRGTPTFSLDAPVDSGDASGRSHADPVAGGPDPSEAVDQRDFARAVRAAVLELPDDFREAVLLRDLQGLNYEDIASVLGVAAGTVRSRIHRGRLLLQKKLEGFA